MTEEIKVEAIKEEAIPQEKEQTQEIKTENEQDINWRKFRQQREEERKQKEAAEKYARQKEEEAAALKLAMEALVNKPTQVREEYQEEESEDQKIDKKVREALHLRELEIEKQRVERDRAEFPLKLQSHFKDFNQVCTSENLDYLEFHFPEVARGYKYMPDGYEKWEGIYLALKKFIPNKNSLQEGKKAENNLSKPQSMSKGGMTQTGDHPPIRTDAATRAANYARMQKIIKGL